MKQKLNAIIILLTLLSLLLLSTFIQAGEPPSIKIKGGKYYISIEGVRVKRESDGTDKPWNTDHTAKAAAINYAFQCNCAVHIEQPTLKVIPTLSVAIVIPNPTTETHSIQLQWDIPTLLEDGSSLASSDIKSYLLKYRTKDNPIEISKLILGGTTTQITLMDMPQGIYTFTIATVTGSTGKPSEPITVEI